MVTNVHPLQELSVKLLRALYLERNLPVTPAMLSIINERYASIEDILNTLQRYNNEDLVVDFVRTNEVAISEAKEALKQAKLAEAEKKNNINEEVFSSVFSNIFSDSKPITKLESISAYSCIKEKSLKDIEDALSRELSRLCNEELILEIESIQKSDNSSDADLKIHVKPKNPWRIINQ
jgi:hypothetical protein